MIFAGVKGYLDKVDVKHVTEYEKDLLSALRTSGAAMLAEIAEKQKLDEGLEKQLHDFIGAFSAGFVK